VLYVADYWTNSVESYNPANGRHLRTVATVPAACGIVLIDQHLYVSSGLDERVHKLTLEGKPVCTWRADGHGVPSNPGEQRKASRRTSTEP
jgi:hypothetical protein